MASHGEGVNPLRPYYIPPSIGEPLDHASRPNPRPLAAAPDHAGRYAFRARDILNDIDYKDYLSEPSPSIMKTVKDLVDELLWKYTVVLIAQPFGVAKTILQVRVQDDLGSLATAAGSLRDGESLDLSGPSRTSPSRTPSGYGDGFDAHYGDSDSENDEVAYFTSNMTPVTPTPSRRRLPARRTPSQSTQSSSLPKDPRAAARQLDLQAPDSIRAVIGQLWQKEGAWGVWKGANATFIYTVLQSLLENWSRSCLSAVFNVPDLGVKDDIDRLVDIASPYPWASLLVAGTAAVATGLILAPLDLVRTRLLLTSTARAPRRTLSALKTLPSYLCPRLLVLPTMLHSLVGPLLTLSTPLVLRSRFLIDSAASPVAFSVAGFVSSCAAVFVKLPLETVLRRGQVSVLAAQHQAQAQQTKTLDGRDSQKLETIVPVGAYKGVLGTMVHIVSEEGSHAIPVKTPTTQKSGSSRAKGKAKGIETRYEKGQGLEGLWRGFGVSWWGLVGLWTVGLLGSSGDGEF